MAQLNQRQKFGVDIACLPRQANRLVDFGNRLPQPVDDHPGLSLKDFRLRKQAGLADPLRGVFGLTDKRTKR